MQTRIKSIESRISKIIKTNLDLKKSKELAQSEKPTWYINHSILKNKLFKRKMNLIQESNSYYPWFDNQNHALNDLPDYLQPSIIRTLEIIDGDKHYFQVQFFNPGNSLPIKTKNFRTMNRSLSKYVESLRCYSEKKFVERISVLDKLIEKNDKEYKLLNTLNRFLFLDKPNSQKQLKTRMEKLKSSMKL